jgi:hypothetical protein
METRVESIDICNGSFARATFSLHLPFNVHATATIMFSL